MSEEIVKTIENVDKLFSEIVVNGVSHKSQRFTAPAPQSNPSPHAQVQGEDVHAVELNDVLHNFSDPDVVTDVQNLQQGLANEILARQNADQSLNSDVDSLKGKVATIEGEIPSQASAQNQLADKNFVNSSIATNTANFLGTYTSMADIEAIPNPTNNDYVFLQTTDSAGNNLFDRYKYNADQEEWLFEYELNNSSFTAEQWATINSGLTQSSVTQEIEDAIAGATIGHANEADKLSTARDLKVNLASVNAQSFNGTANATSIGVAGTLPVGNGGTGQTSQADVNKAIIGNLSSGSSDVTDGTEFVSSYASDNGFSDTNALNVPYKRSFLRVWNYIKGKISSVLGLTATSYGGKASTAGTADSAGSAGSAGKLTTARKVYVKLGTASTTETKDFSGDTAIPVNGTLNVANGGTGQTTLALARNAMGLGNTTGALPVANGGTGQTSLANVSVGSATNATNATNATKLSNIAVTTTTPQQGDSGNCWAYITKSRFVSSFGYIVYSNGLKAIWGYCTTAGTNVSVNFNTNTGITFASRDSYFIWIQDCDDSDPRTRTTQGDTGGYDMVSGIDQQYTTYFCVTKPSSRKFYWLAIGY